MGRQRTLEEARLAIFAKSVVTESGCREYLGVLRRGYGVMWFRGKGGQLVHRIAWEAAHGPIPEGMRVLHHCDNPSCFQPEPSERWPDGHLFLGTQIDNIMDMKTKGRSKRGRRQSHCRNGHPMVPPHVGYQVSATTGEQVQLCRTCRRERSTPWRRERRSILKCRVS